MTTRDFFNRISVSENPLLFSETDQRKIKRLKQRLGDLTGLRVLEPGCGVGPLTEYLSKWVGPSGRVLAFDSSPGMVRECQRRLGHLRNVEIREAAMELVKLTPASWDLAILFRVFPHFDDKGSVLHRLRPCLAPTGRLVIANLEGSARLNALHASFSDPVRHDHMPCARVTACLLEETGWQVIEAVDEPEEFFVLATPQPPA